MILLRIHHVDVLAADQLGLDERVILAGDQLVLDILVVELLEDADILGDDLRVVLPADEMERLGRGGEGAPRQARHREAGRSGQHPFEDPAPTREIATQSRLPGAEITVHAPSPPLCRLCGCTNARPTGHATLDVPLKHPTG